ncbi:helix-turn-helix domain-containing protein [Leptospira langatensis]|uniref:Helix-turn-helix domain-containing protein n=1 Tax=Leptospira langatensis TaxID=2484983 RepID=A0A5F1ZZ71_9LEPT|nr:helix-turn-helix domain-containing protein [Leptospira langatensis]TGJ98383.1 helix-turn-helix domain-containing protein [Leptospira langatensis]TGL43297.1 helix-turn-helix domain-containing protein [Leptospira langatensis]
MSRLTVFLVLALIFGVSTQTYAQGDENGVGHLRILNRDHANWKQIDDFSVLLDWGFYSEPIDLRFRIGNLPEESKTEFLIFPWSHLDSVQVCDLKEENCVQAGFGHPVDEWLIPGIFPVFPLRKFLEHSSEINVRIQSRNYILSEVRLVSAEELYSITTLYSAIMFSLLAVVIVQIAYLLNSYFRLRSKWILYQILFSFGMALTFLFVSGIASRYLFPGFGFPLSLGKKIMIGYLIISGTLWVSHFLKIRQNFKPIWYFYNAVNCISGILIVLSFTPFPRLFISRSFTILYLAVTGIAIVLSIIAMKRKTIQTRWFVMSMFSLLAIEILNIISYKTYFSFDGKSFLFFMGFFVPINIFLTSRVVRTRIRELEFEIALRRKELENFQNGIMENQSDPSGEKRKSTIIGINVEETLARLNRLLDEDKIYMEEELRISDLAAVLGLSVHQVSELLNQVLNISFPDLLKKYRIEEAKRIIANNPSVNILNLAFSVGFQSKSSFYDSFKKYTGLTPQEFRKTFLPDSDEEPET